MARGSPPLILSPGDPSQLACPSLELESSLGTCLFRSCKDEILARSVGGVVWGRVGGPGGKVSSVKVSGGLFGY